MDCGNDKNRPEESVGGDGESRKPGTQYEVFRISCSHPFVQMRLPTVHGHCKRHQRGMSSESKGFTNDVEVDACAVSF